MPRRTSWGVALWRELLLLGTGDRHGLGPKCDVSPDHCGEFLWAVSERVDAIAGNTIGNARILGGERYLIWCCQLIYQSGLGRWRSLP